VTRRRARCRRNNQRQSHHNHFTQEPRKIQWNELSGPKYSNRLGRVVLYSRTLLEARMFAQRPSLRFLATGAVISLFVLTFLLFAHQSRDSASSYILKTHRPAQSVCSISTPQNGSDTWEFRVERDGQNHGLSDAQCRSAFPKLFIEIDKSAEPRRESRLSYKDLDSREVEDGMVRAIIDRGEVSRHPNICYPLPETNHIHYSST
jgi:hypothetical protein